MIPKAGQGISTLHEGDMFCDSNTSMGINLVLVINLTVQMYIF